MNLNYAIMIKEELEKYEGVEIIKIENTSVEAKVNGHELNIYGEICSCHGGRLSIDIKDVGYYRIEYAEYTEERFDGDSEMEYAIKNDMINEINQIINYTYIVKVWESYNGDHIPKVSYHTSFIGAKAYSLDLSYDIKDFLDVVVDDLINYPNQDIKSLVTKVETIENGIEFETARLIKGVEETTVRRKRSQVLFFNKGKFELKVKKGELK